MIGFFLVSVRVSGRSVKDLRWFFLESKYRNRNYANKFFLCEALNLVNVILQW